MKIRGLTPILNVSDVPASLAWFERFGWSRGFAWNAGGMMPPGIDRNHHGPATFASVCADPNADSGAQIFLCRDGQGVRGGKPARFDGHDDCGAVWMSWWVDRPAEVDEAHTLAVKHGATVLTPPTNEPWNVRECKIMHPDGHVFRVSAQLQR